MSRPFRAREGTLAVTLALQEPADADEAQARLHIVGAVDARHGYGLIIAYQDRWEIASDRHSLTRNALTDPERTLPFAIATLEG